MNDYTVILLVPDYATEDFGADVYISNVMANGPHEAATKAQHEYAVSHDVDDDDDLRPVAVMPGKVEVLLNAYDF